MTSEHSIQKTIHNSIRRNMFESEKKSYYKVYHSSNEKFTQFKLEKITNLGGDLYGKGFYFTDNLNYSENFGKITYECLVTLKNPLNLTNSNSKNQLTQLVNYINDIPEKDLEYISGSIQNNSFTTAFRKIRDFISFESLHELYDGVIGWSEEGGREYIVYNPKNIKITNITVSE